ncbi:MAG: alkaline shock response membrane anchor protein AmaP [Deltaproteobacteria bacterium]
MRTVINTLVFSLICAFLGALALAFAFHIITFEQVYDILVFLYTDGQSRLVTGAAGVLFVLLSLGTVQGIAGRIQREKTIAFSNPNGQVTITLSAVEDLVKRLSFQLREIKDARAIVKATKKGIDIRMRVVLRAETNVPDFTAKLQDLIATKIQEVFGLDEPIVVRIHVAKIVSVEEKPKKKEDRRAEPPEEYMAVTYQWMKI